MHKFMKMAGCNTEEEFYQKYPSEKDFFAAYPHMKGNQTMKNGGAASGHSGSYWNGERWVSTAGDSGTYANGVYYQQGGNYDAYIPTPGSVSTGKDISLRPYVTLMTYPGDTLTNNQIPYATRSAYDYGTSVYPGGIGLRGKQSPLRYKPSEKDIQKMIQYENQMNLLEKAKSKMGYYGTDEMPAPYKLNGGPVFMPGGSAPIFGMGGSASFNVSNNQYPTPFAMAPGSGRGGGYLQDLPTHMSHGGPIPGAEIVDPFAMYPGTGKGGGMLQDLPVEMKKGGIHIAPSKRGTFTAAATKHGKSVQAFASQVLANKENYSPAMVKKANFARNAAKWKHEYGGSTIMQKGGPLLPNNPSGYADSIINANQQSPFYRDLKVGKAPKNMDFYQNDNSYDYNRVTEDPNNPYVGNSTDFLPHGYYVGTNQWGEGNKAMYTRVPLDQSVNPVSRMYIGAGPDNVLKFPSKTAADIFQQEIEKRIATQGKKIKQDGGKTMPDNPGFRALPPAVQQKIMDNMQTGGMVTADRMVYMPGGTYMQGGQFPSFEETGGMVNPYHPMAKFLRGGYYESGGVYNIGQYVPGLGYWNGSSFQATNPNSFAASNMGEAEEFPSVMPPVPSPVPPVQNQNWHPPMSAPNNTATTTTATTESEDESENESEHPGLDKARNWGNAILGTGMTALGVAGALNERTQARKLRNKQFNDRSTANMYVAMNQPGGKGDYTQQGVFRPDSMTPTAAGKFYPGMGKYGGMMQMGGVMNNYTYAHGGYHVGQEVELSDAEIANLKRMGYKFDII